MSKKKTTRHNNRQQNRQQDRGRITITDGINFNSRQFKESDSIYFDVDTLSVFADTNVHYAYLFNLALCKANGALNSGGVLELKVTLGPFAGKEIVIFLFSEKGAWQAPKKMAV